MSFTKSTPGAMLGRETRVVHSRSTAPMAIMHTLTTSFEDEHAARRAGALDSKGSTSINFSKAAKRRKRRRRFREQITKSVIIWTVVTGPSCYRYICNNQPEGKQRHNGWSPRFWHHNADIRVGQGVVVLLQGVRSNTANARRPQTVTTPGACDPAYRAGWTEVMQTLSLRQIRA